MVNATPLKVEIYCDICKTNLLFVIGADNFRRVTKFPVRFRYQHGRPMHTANVIIDKNLKVVNTEFSALRKQKRVSKGGIEEFLFNLQFTNLHELAGVFLKLCDELPRVMDVRSSEAENKLYDYGFEVGDKLAQIMKSQNEADILRQVGDVFARNKLGNISNTKVTGNLTVFEIMNCYENVKANDGARTFYRLAQGFFRNLFQKQFQKSYLINTKWYEAQKMCRFELQCMWSNFAEQLRRKMQNK